MTDATERKNDLMLELINERDIARADLDKACSLSEALKDTIRILEADLDREQDLHAGTKQTLAEVREALGIAPGVKVQDAARDYKAVVDAARRWRRSLPVQGGVADSWTAETKALVHEIDAFTAQAGEET
jgi:hypothetical protein